MSLKVLLLNCTLKKSSELSNTGTLLNKVKNLMLEEDSKLDVSEIQITDYSVYFGTTSDEKEGDEWPLILNKILNCDILIIGTPVHSGLITSITQMVLERLSGTLSDELTEKAQVLLYGKVAGIVACGSEDGVHAAGKILSFRLINFGCLVPPNAYCYWVGGISNEDKSYLGNKGDKNYMVNRCALLLAHSTIYMAKLLKKHPIPIDFNEIDHQARRICDKD